MSPQTRQFRSEDRPRVLFLVGPTGVGKTEVALQLAPRLDAEIVSADSRQVYRHLNIGTAKPSPEDLARVPHHLIDLLDPDEDYNAGFFARDGRRVIDDILGRGHLPLVVGGSGLYIRALVDGFYDANVRDPELKRVLQERAAREGTPRLHAELAAVDPQTAARLHPNDTQRVIRALEVIQLTGRPFSELQSRENVPADFDPFFVGLQRQRSELYAMIDARVEAMIRAGLVEEVRGLQKLGYGPQLNALQTVGYREVFQFLRGEIGEEEMIAEIKKNSRRYAKRQLTWFRRDPRIVWIDVTGETDAAVISERILQLLKEAGFSVG